MFLGRCVSCTYYFHSKIKTVLTNRVLLLAPCPSDSTCGSGGFPPSSVYLQPQACRQHCLGDAGCFYWRAVCSNTIVPCVHIAVGLPLLLGLCSETFRKGVFGGRREFIPILFNSRLISHNLLLLWFFINIFSGTLGSLQHFLFGCPSPVTYIYGSMYTHVASE